MADLRCPKCGSEETQSVPVVYRTGTETIRMRAGVGKNRRNVLRVVQSELAASVAPPAKKTAYLFYWGLGLSIAGLVFGWPELLLVVMSVANGGLAVPSCCACVSIPAAVVGICMVIPGYSRYLEAKAYNERVWAGLHAEWGKSVFCHRCGHVFVPTE